MWCRRLTEFFFTGCEVGYYGQNCKMRCDTCPQQKCDAVFGHCLLPCPRGRIGKRCENGKHLISFKYIDFFVLVSKVKIDAILTDSLKKNTSLFMTFSSYL